MFEKPTIETKYAKKVSQQHPKSEKSEEKNENEDKPEISIINQNRMTPGKITGKPKSRIAKNASKLKSKKQKIEKQHLKGEKMSSSTPKSKNVQDIRSFFETLQAGQNINLKTPDKVVFGAAVQTKENYEAIPRPKTSRLGGIIRNSSNSPAYSKEHHHIKPQTGLVEEKGSIGHKINQQAELQPRPGLVEF